MRKTNNEFEKEMKPHVLLIGDSIRMHYTPLVKRGLKNRAKIVVIKENCEDSLKIRDNILGWLKKSDPDRLKIVHFNCGLHDIKRPFGSLTNQQPLDHYTRNLEEIVSLLQKHTRAQLIWATITPVIYNRHHGTKDFDRFEEDVMLYNETALKVIEAAEIPINDLNFIITSNDPEKCIDRDGVHMTKRGNVLLADQVIKVLSDYLP